MEKLIEKNCTSIKEALDSFCELSRQKVNNGKSRVYFSPTFLRERRDELCSCLDLHSIPNLGKYLGFPLKLLGTKNQEFDFVIERVQGRLSGWKAHLLSFAGRVFITQLGCLLSRLMSCKESCCLEKPLKPLIKLVEILSGDLLWKK